MVIDGGCLLTRLHSRSQREDGSCCSISLQGWMQVHLCAANVHPAANAWVLLGCMQLHGLLEEAMTSGPGPAQQGAQLGLTLGEYAATLDSCVHQEQMAEMRLLAGGRLSTMRYEMLACHDRWCLEKQLQAGVQPQAGRCVRTPVFTKGIAGMLSDCGVHILARLG